VPLRLYQPRPAVSTPTVPHGPGGWPSGRYRNDRNNSRRCKRGGFVNPASSSESSDTSPVPAESGRAARHLVKNAWRAIHDATGAELQLPNARDDGSNHPCMRAPGAQFTAGCASNLTCPWASRSVNLHHERLLRWCDRLESKQCCAPTLAGPHFQPSVQTCAGMGHLGSCLRTPMMSGAECTRHSRTDRHDSVR
jgi:hypothetical protein